MSLQRELSYPNPIESLSHEAALALFYTAQLFAKGAYSLLRPYGMTDSQFNVLTVLRYQSPPEGLTQSDLSRMMLVNRSNITGLLDRLEEAGWVEREEDSDDRRVKRVRLTNQGRTTLDPAVDAYLAFVDQTMGALTQDERLCLLDLLQGLWRPLKGGVE